MQLKDLVIIGAGPAGMAAALAARKHGVQDILILERGDKAGGILPQCVHSGFGLHQFNEELTGPEYALRFLQGIRQTEIPIQLNTMVTDITPDKIITAMSKENGVQHIQAKAIILAMGCRERTRGAIGIPGTRPAGVLTAGTAQRFVNMEGLLPGKRFVILGSGDIGLIMARRLTLSGCHVDRVCEILPKSGGLQRNISQCLNDFNIPLLLSTTVCEIHGKDRVEAVTTARVDENLRVIPNTKETITCDTLLLSVGLIPENELSKAAGVVLAKNGGAQTDPFMATNVPGIFACGNVVHVHDLVDFVTQESQVAGKSAAKYILGEPNTGDGYTFQEKKENLGLRELAPHERELICIVCPVGCPLTVSLDAAGQVENVAGNRCNRGIRYAQEEFTAPRRVLTSTVRVDNNRFAPVKTKGTIPKELLFPAMEAIRKVKADAPQKAGSAVLKDLLGTGVDLVLTDDVD